MEQYWKTISNRTIAFSLHLEKRIRMSNYHFLSDWFFLSNLNIISERKFMFVLMLVFQNVLSFRESRSGDGGRRSENNKT